MCVSDEAEPLKGGGRVYEPKSALSLENTQEREPLRVSHKKSCLALDTGAIRLKKRQIADRRCAGR